MTAHIKIEIEKGKPIPSRRSGCASYPFAEMEVGDSFAIPVAGLVKYKGNNGKKDLAYNRLSGSAHIHGRRNGKKFTIRTLKDEGVVRCWRVK